MTRSFTTDVALHLVLMIARPTTDYHTRVRLERAVLAAVESMAPWTTGAIQEAWHALDAFRKGARP